MGRSEHSRDCISATRAADDPTPLAGPSLVGVIAGDDALFDSDRECESATSGP
jgi:hypothetical protein